MSTSSSNSRKPSYETVMRYIRVLPLLLREKGMSRKEMEKVLGLKRQSTYDFVETLTSYHGADLVELSSGNFRLNDKTGTYQDGIKPIRLSPEQRMALSFILSIDMPYLPSNIRQEKRNLLDSLGLQDQQGNSAAAVIRDAAKLFILSNIGKLEGNPNQVFFNDPDILDNLLFAIDEQLSCRVSYQSRSGEIKSFVIDPLRFFEKQGAPYVLVRIGRHPEFRSLRPGGIQAIEMLENKFEAVEDSVIEAYIDSAFGAYYGQNLSVKIWFDAEVAHLIAERRWAHNQVLHPMPDGSLEIMFTASGELDILRWVMGYGHHARVLEPPRLVALVREATVRAAAALKEQ